MGKCRIKAFYQFLLYLADDLNDPNHLNQLNDLNDPNEPIDLNQP